MKGIPSSARRWSGGGVARSRSGAIAIFRNLNEFVTGQICATDLNNELGLTPMEQKQGRLFKIVEGFIDFLDKGVVIVIGFGGIFGILYLVFIGVEFVSGTMQSRSLSTVIIFVLLVAIFWLASNSKHLANLSVQLESMQSRLEEQPESEVQELIGNIEKELHWVHESLEQISKQEEAIARIEEQLESLEDGRIAKRVIEELEDLRRQVKRISIQLEEQARPDPGKRT